MVGKTIGRCFFMQNELRKICEIFQIEGEFLDFKEVSSGHINHTYAVRVSCFGEVEKYIVQKINTYVFKDPIGVMQNIASVTEFIREKLNENNALSDRSVLQYLKKENGDYYHMVEDGCWRCCHFIDGAATYLRPENEGVVEQSGRAFGEFQKYLIDYPVSELNIVIPHFHNTILRFSAFREALENDLVGRKSEIADEIAGYFALEEVACEPYKMQIRREIPLRVTHNDTKTSNVLFDENTNERLCVIDLDTVMPGLVAFDFGDAIRIASNMAEEDEKDLSKVAFNLAYYEAFAKGFLGELGGLISDNEKKSLPLGAIAMTVECGVRFLTDYLNGDKYFRVHYPEHNLVRARCQLALARDMLKHFDEMREIINKYC